KKGDMKPSYAYRQAAFVDVADPGLKILPTHRLLPKDMTVDAFLGAADRWLLPCPTKDAIFVVVHPDGTRMGLKLRPDFDLAKEKELANTPEAVRRLDVTILHRLILERGLGIEAGAKEHALGYVRSPAEGEEKLKAGTHGG